MVKRSIDQKLRLRNFDARQWKFERGAVVKSRKGAIGVKGGNGICYQCNAKRPVFANDSELSPRSAATKDCRLTHGINLDYRKTFLEIDFLRLILPEIILEEFNQTTCKETVKQPLKPEG